MFSNDARQTLSTSINIMIIFYNTNSQKALGSLTFVLTNILKREVGRYSYT